MKKPARFNPYLGTERIEWLLVEARRLQIKPSDLLRRIIDEYREKKEGGK